MEYQLTVTLTEHGRRLDSGEKLSHGFASTHPDAEAVIEQNTESGMLSATFWYHADDFREAAERGSAIFTDAADASGLAPTAVVDAHLVAVEPDRELQPA